MFALVEEAGERLDGRVVAWGMEFDDHAELVGSGGAIRGSFSCADSARQVLSYSRRGTMHLVWCHPTAAT